jgi:hypothetical protein
MTTTVSTEADSTRRWMMQTVSSESEGGLQEPARGEARGAKETAWEEEAPWLTGATTR